MRRRADLRRRFWPRRVGFGCVLFFGQFLLAVHLEAASSDEAAPNRVSPQVRSDRSLQWCLDTLQKGGLEQQLVALQELKEAGPAAAAATPILCDLLARSDGATDHILLASILDVFRSLGADAAPAAETLSRLLPHRSQLNTGRDKMLVVRLRAYIFVTLSEIGFPDSALPALLDSLAHVDERVPAVEIGSAARAVRSLGPRGHQFAPYLLGTLLERFSEEEFSLEGYGPKFSPKDATTVQLESVRSLGRISSAKDHQVSEVLLRLAGDRGDDLDPRVVQEAKNALKLISSRDSRRAVNQVGR
ncbi:MAG TPA: hypothetical protein VNP98_18095 [Chthoniobacterales bacterium]|nr:hypothetical protein [Chthoniobacterales bacterium]